MERKFIAGMAIATCVAAPGAWAIEGPYVGAKGSIVWADDSDWAFEGNGTIESEYDTNFGLAAVLGTGTAAGVRVEGELFYRSSDIDGGNIGAVELDELGGDVSQWGVMANAYYDFDLGSPVKPFVGAGIGAAQINADVDLGSVDVIDDDSTEFAYQLTAGLMFEVSPNLMITGAYRYQATSDAEFEDELGTTVDFDWASHNLDVGLLFVF
ncbi:MAG: outer membrane beta-barrel protein [Pseudomonadota bacterium]|nr:outer membrane beta-barrel protein [Pseudomonadota bacterium]